MFDQLIWYFCLAFSSACACAGQPRPCTGRPAGPSPAPLLRPSRGAGQDRSGGQRLPPRSSPSPPPCSGCNLLAAPGQPPIQAFPSSFKRRNEMCGSLPCPWLRSLKSLWLQQPLLCSCGLLLGLGWESSPCAAVPGASRPAPALPGPRPPSLLLKAKPVETPIFAPTSAPFPHTAGSYRWGDGTGWDVAAAPSGLAPCPTPPAALALGGPPGEGQQYPPAPGAGTARFQGSTESRGKWDFTSFAEDAVNAVFGLLVAFLHLLPFQLSLLFLAFPKFAPQDAADGAHFGGSAEL